MKNIIRFVVTLGMGALLMGGLGGCYDNAATFCKKNPDQCIKPK